MDEPKLNFNYQIRISDDAHANLAKLPFVKRQQLRNKLRETIDDFAEFELSRLGKKLPTVREMREIFKKGN